MHLFHCLKSGPKRDAFMKELLHLLHKQSVSSQMKTNAMYLGHCLLIHTVQGPVVL